jgi:hypothetical protein
MKPRNFPLRKLRRQAVAARNRGDDLTTAQEAALRPGNHDIRFRHGAANRDMNGLPK